MKVCLYICTFGDAGKKNDKNGCPLCCTICQAQIVFFSFDYLTFLFYENRFCKNGDETPKMSRFIQLTDFFEMRGKKEIVNGRLLTVKKGKN